MVNPTIPEARVPYYSAAWTECGCLITCGHQHRSVGEVLACIQSAGGYAVAVEANVMRCLTAREEVEFQCAVHPLCAKTANPFGQILKDIPHVIPLGAPKEKRWWNSCSDASACVRRRNSLPRKSMPLKARSGVREEEAMTKHLNSERRVALEKRRRVAEMSPEEMRLELLTSEVTGLPNRRAFDEAGAPLVVGMSDLDGLKAVNDYYGYEAGNVLLRTKAAALGEAGLEAYHDKGDEFLCRGQSLKELEANLERARGILRSRSVVVKHIDATVFQLTGADFSYGVGEDMSEAESRLKIHKANRHASGELKRGQLCGITETSSLETGQPWVAATRASSAAIMQSVEILNRRTVTKVPTCDMNFREFCSTMTQNRG